MGCGGTKSTSTQPRFVVPAEYRDIYEALDARDPDLFSRSVFQINGAEFAAKVMHCIRNTTSYHAKSRPVSASRRTHSSRSLKFIHSRAGERAKAIISQLENKTHFSSYELEQLCQEISDILQSEPLEERHARMFFTQHGMTPRVIDLLMVQLGFSPPSGVVPSGATPMDTSKPEGSGEVDKPPELTPQHEQAQQIASLSPQDRELVYCCRIIDALSVFEKGENEEKMYFYFKLFDLNGDGSLEPDELQVLSDFMQETYQKVTGRSGKADARAKMAIEVLMKEVISEVDQGDVDGIPLSDVLQHPKLMQLWELLKIINM